MTAPLLLAGCLVGPDFRPPGADTPAGWVGVNEFGNGQTSVANSGPAALARWWGVFHDRELDALIDRAVTANLDLRLAASHIREARATRAVNSAALLPVVSTSGSYDRAHAGGASRDAYRAGFDASWELDVFGGVRRSVEAADANIDFAIEDRRDLLVTLVAELADDYTDLRGLQKRLVIARQNLESQKRSLDLTRRRLQGGFVSGLDVANAEAQVASTEAVIPILESNARQAAYAIAVLLALPPAALLDELSAPGTTLVTPPVVPVGLPSDLLRRRPDVRRAEAQVHVATARIGVATAELFPRFSLGGSLAVSGSQFSALGNWANRGWSVGPAVSWPIFEGGRIRANIEVQNAAQEQTLIAYAQVILRSLQEVENALVAYSREQRRHAALATAVDANRRAESLATRLYEQGRTDFLNVLSAQRSLFSSEDALIQSDVALAQQLITTYKALGGGWEWEVEAAAPATQPATRPAP